jgi:hypothetical protein
MVLLSMVPQRVIIEMGRGGQERARERDRERGIGQKWKERGGSYSVMRVGSGRERGREDETDIIGQQAEQSRKPESREAKSARLVGR